MKKLALGVDIGGTSTKFGFVDEEGNCLGEHHIPTDTHSTIYDFFQALKEAVNTLAASHGEFEWAGMGVGAPNGNYHTGTIDNAPNLNWKGIVPFVEVAQKFFEGNIVLTNDANAAAIGEMTYGGAKEMTDFIAITLGTGLGSGVVANGKLIYGHDGMAGELGHITVKEGGRLCRCGQKGCLETYASATGIKRTAFDLMAYYPDDSALREFAYKDLTAAMISEIANQGDGLAQKAFDVTADMLGKGLATAIAHTSPQAIFIMGGLAKAGEILLEPTRKYLNRYVFHIYRNKVQILSSGLGKGNPAVLGASALIWQEKRLSTKVA